MTGPLPLPPAGPGPAEASEELADLDYRQLLGEMQLSEAEQAALAGEPLYPDCQSWVQQWFLPMFGRFVGSQIHWCEQWWAHEEAVMRLDNLWFTWEHQRTRPGLGLSEWLNQHLDPQLQVLFSAYGPFGACTPTEHNPPKPLAGCEPPEGWWQMDRNQRELSLATRGRRVHREGVKIGG